jgi:hypothetical protein
MHAVAEGETKARIKTGKHGLARVTGGRGTATRAMGLLGAIFSYAVERKLRTDNRLAESSATRTASAIGACRKPSTPRSVRRCGRCPRELGP